MTCIEITAGSYHASVSLDPLPSLPLANIRKLFTLMLRANYDNAETIRTVADWLPGAVTDAKNNWGAESSIFSAGWRNMDQFSCELPRSMTPKARRQAVSRQRQLNRALRASLTRAKAHYEKMVKVQKSFNELKEKYYA